MKRAVAIVLIAELCLALTASAKIFEWRINSPQARAETFTAYHGETIRFNPIWTGSLSNVTASALYYQAPGMEESWWSADGLVFDPTNDMGAASYRFFILAYDPEGVNYSANGYLRLIDSPGFVPNIIDPPVKTLDFDHVDFINAPWAESFEFVLATNELHSALAGKAELNICEGAEFTTNDLWLCEWSGEVLPLRLTGPLVTWQKAYGTKPAVIYESYGGASRWRLSSDGYGDFLNVDGDATARILDFGDGLVVRRLTGGAHVVYSDELSRAVSGIAAPDYSTGNAELVATIEATAPAPGDYAAVSNKAMTALQSYTETDPTISSWAKASSKPTYTLNDVAPSTENWLGVPGTTAGGKSIKVLAKTVNGVIEGGMTVTGSSNNDNNTTKYRYGGVTATRDGTATDYLFDTSSQSGIVRRSELTPLSSSISTVSAMLNAENARFVSTNYNSSSHMPEAYVEAKVDGNWLSIWSEMTRWNWLTGQYLPANFYTKSQTAALLDDKADRAWGFFDSHTGNYAPDGYTWISSPKIAISGGLAYSRTLTSEGAAWVLEANGLVAETGGVVSNGFFRISDDEGNALMEIVKGDKRMVGAQAGSVEAFGAFTPTKLQIGYPVVAESHPVLKITASLNNPAWYAESDASCPANVTWSGTSGNYVATVQAKSSSATSIFVKAEYEVGGETYIKNSAAISVQAGILCTDGVHKVRPVYNNGAITWEVVQ